MTTGTELLGAATFDHVVGPCRVFGERFEMRTTVAEVPITASRPASLLGRLAWAVDRQVIDGSPPAAVPRGGDLDEASRTVIGALPTRGE